MITCNKCMQGLLVSADTLFFNTLYAFIGNHFKLNMRLSLLRASERHLGNLGKAYGWYHIRIGPNEQKVWKGFFTDAFVKPVKEQLPHWWMFFFPVTTYFLVVDWAKKEYRRLGRIKDFTDG